MDDADAIVAFARSIWPKSFTKRQAEAALGTRIRRLDKIKGLMNTRVRTYDNQGRPYCLWRYRPVQLRLPLGDE
jgi:hypothetical protein